MSVTYVASATSGIVLTPVTLDPGSIPAMSVATETVTVDGLAQDMIVAVAAPSLVAGVALISAQVSAANTLKLTFFNFTNAAINPASQQILVKVV